ncbi:DUF2334 domain-containing protein [Clostridium paridis]|uniref:DUF2334 domain-containing protein n=1 Tax=Clostridium paridis TaxID=2803863 RepID=A0A937FHX1_9CLOT|nr:DUF2334 domain-containing protein [Clostridium paridis]MBL4933340.1 DUF2334 domain-containing protein [Clostridium paridis]
MKYLKKTVLSMTVLTTLLFVGCNTKQQSSSIANDDSKSMEKVIKNFKGLDLEKEKIDLNIEGKKMDLSLPIYTEKNRYYIPLTELVDRLQGEITEEDGLIKVNILNEEIKINKSSNSYVDKDNEEKKFKKPLIEKEGVIYITFNDFSKAFNMVSRWNDKDKSIKAYKSRKKTDFPKYQKKIDTYGFIRLEDVSIDKDSEGSLYYETLRVIGDDLGGRGVPFSVAWIPKFEDPSKNIEVDPSKDYDMNTSELVYTLDYLENKGGVIGLHGYTHQRGKDASGIGAEFGPENPDIGDMIERVKKAKELAKEMDIEPGFFEAPHYKITKKQNDALEDYFKVIYNPYRNENGAELNTSNIYRRPNGKSLYIGTPLDYVHGEDNGDIIKNKIMHLPKGVMASLFFHPRLEMKYIKFNEDTDGYPNYEQDKNSVLNKIIDSLQDKGYDMKDIRSL